MILKRIDVISAGKVSGALYAALGFIGGALFSLISLLGFAAEGPGGRSMLFGIGAIIILPIFYGVMGFIGGIIGAAVYNLAASFVGGIEFDFQD